MIHTPCFNCHGNSERKEGEVWVLIQGILRERNEVNEFKREREGEINK